MALSRCHLPGCCAALPSPVVIWAGIANSCSCCREPFESTKQRLGLFC